MWYIDLSIVFCTALQFCESLCFQFVHDIDWCVDFFVRFGLLKRNDGILEVFTILRFTIELTCHWKAFCLLIILLKVQLNIFNTGLSSTYQIMWIIKVKVIIVDWSRCQCCVCQGLQLLVSFGDLCELSSLCVKCMYLSFLDCKRNKITCEVLGK